MNGNKDKMAIINSDIRNDLSIFRKNLFLLHEYYHRFLNTIISINKCNISI